MFVQPKNNTSIFTPLNTGRLKGRRRGWSTPRCPHVWRKNSRTALLDAPIVDKTWLNCPLGCPPSGQNFIKAPLDINESQLSARWSPATYRRCPFYFCFPCPSKVLSEPLPLSIIVCYTNIHIYCVIPYVSWNHYIFEMVMWKSWTIDTLVLVHMEVACFCTQDSSNPLSFSY